ncbi:MAG: DNA mismatch repair endonuclease MutL, partial [Clostridia bacterium]|nr:DNA mismatch repair endonuclease MutL [Clostridia bacterium]
MGKINVLGFEIANLIAAGEVVDRPASVVKELLENAIDAGATEIVCEIRAGGISMIRVSDNGCGMSPEDLPVAIRRHATSKIHSADDLASISTLGFRGEALAAIAAVSELKIISKTKDAATGTLLSASGGNITEITDVGCADGTTVLVENLFASVPARRKFLKRDATEAAAVSAMVEKVAMSRPDIALTLKIDGSDKFSTPGDGNLQNALYALLGRDFATRLLAVKGESGGIAVSGFVGRSDNARGNRNAQNVFINARYVRSKTVTAALERAFNSYMAPEKFPVAVLFLTCDPRVVDVNVHPAKLEVRFSNEQAVFEAVYYAVRAALEAGQGRPELTLENTRRTSYRVDKDPADTGADRYRVTAPQTGKTPLFGASYSGGATLPRDTRPPVSIPPRAGGSGAYVARPVAPATTTPEESNRFLSDLAKAKENAASG